MPDEQYSVELIYGGYAVAAEGKVSITFLTQIIEGGHGDLLIRLTGTDTFVIDTATYMALKIRPLQ